jgi:hypothetical protein
LAAEGNLTAAMRAFVGYPFNDDDIAANLTHPEALAQAVTEFFAPAQQPA